MDESWPGGRPKNPRLVIHLSSENCPGVGGLRENGLGVILVSHNMVDVQAVADRIVVLRLGRNAAEFNIADVTTADLVAAITGASDNVVAERARRGQPNSTAGAADE